jgi:cysteine desulfuration protein SufE
MTDAEIQEIIDTFELLTDWDQRYQFLVDIGEEMPPMPAAEKTEDNRVKECMSLVHVAAHPDSGHVGCIRYTGDCDTAIIKGVVALLVRLFSGKTPAEIAELDVDALFEGLHLAEHLSPNRHVGIYAIVDKMKAEARVTEPSAQPPQSSARK